MLRPVAVSEAMLKGKALYEALKMGRPLKVEQEHGHWSIGWWADGDVSRSLASGDYAITRDSLAKAIEDLLEYVVYGEEEYHRRRVA